MSVSKSPPKKKSSGYGDVGNQKSQSSSLQKIIRESFVGEHKYYSLITPNRETRRTDLDNSEVWDSGINLLRKNAELE